MIPPNYVIVGFSLSRGHNRPLENMIEYRLDVRSHPLLSPAQDSARPSKATVGALPV